MISKLTIENFKAIKKLSINITSLTVLIGENSCGKSTILQAMDFLCSIVSRDIDEYLKDRDWDFDEIKSQFADSDESIRFSVEFDINNRTTLLWEISINNINDKWAIKESITNTESGEAYLSFGTDKEDFPYNFSRLNIKSSALKMLDISLNNHISLNSMEYHFDLYNLKGLLLSSSSFELLSPDRMRSKGSRGKVDNIGMGGEMLSAYIHNMNPSKRNELNKMVSEFIGYDVKITTSTKGVPGWVEMYLEELWHDNMIKIKKRYISDGLLRIIAFSAILTECGNSIKNNSFYMLDEIEDGINPELSEKLIQLFRKAAVEQRQQFIITSHSPVMVNFLEQDEIIYIWRDKTGQINAKPMFASEGMKDTLDCFNPGEVWLNYKKNEILDLMNSPRSEENV